MLLPLALFYPFAYAMMKTAAMVRHEMCGPMFGMHADDPLMRLVYPL